MASITKYGEKWRAVVRKVGHPTASRIFDRQSHAKAWATKTEEVMRAGEFHHTKTADGVTLSDLIKRYKEARNKPLGRSQLGSLSMLERIAGKRRVPELTSAFWIKYAKERDCGPVTWGQELGLAATIFKIARAVWKVGIPGDPVGDAREALKLFGYKTKSSERDRRPTEDELIRLCAFFDAKGERQIVPMSDIIMFAVHTAMRASEITRITWADFDEDAKTVIIRDRKDPLQKEGNDQTVPILPKALEIILRQPKVKEAIFPYNSRTFSSIFPRACQELGVVDLRFHDLRHEGTSRLFEAGYSIPEVAVWTGHRDWNQLRRYTQIKAHTLHRDAAPSPTQQGEK